MGFDVVAPLHVQTNSAASIADLGSLASSADELSRIYDQASKELPSQEDSRKALSLEDAAAMGALAAEHAAELSAATRGPCSGCMPDSQESCPLHRTQDHVVPWSTWRV